MKLDFKTDDGIGTRANLGVIVLKADETLEHELRRILPDRDVALYVSRIPMHPEVRPDTLAQMEADLPRSAALLPAIEFDAIGFGCTSASTIIGPERVADAITSVCPGAKVSNPLSAIIDAANALKVRRIGFVSPYVDAVSAPMREKLEQAGFDIASVASFDEGDDRVVARITPDSIFAAICAVAADAPCDAVVVSCTNLRCLDVIARAEAAINVPIITSNQALAWDLLRMAGIAAPCPEFGRLFTLAASPATEK